MDDRLTRMLRRGIGDLEDYVPGRSVEEVRAEFGLESVEKMASNENPLGPSPRAVEAARRALAAAHLYPDGNAGALKRALARRFSLQPGHFFVGNGADDVLHNVARAFVNEGDECVIPSPSFHPYTTVTRIMGGIPVYCPLREFRIRLPDVLERVTPRTKLLFLCNPNNPTGTVFGREEWEDFLRRVPPSVVAVLDEAYLDFAEDQGAPRSERYIEKGGPWVVGVRTFSKAYGLAGFRVGYGMAHPDLVRVLHKTKDPFNVSGPALAAAEAALDDEAFLARSLRTVREGKRRLYDGLKSLGVPFVPTDANFILAELGADASRKARELMARGVIVRPCASFGLPDHVRVTVGTAGQNERFLSSLEAVMT